MSQRRAFSLQTVRLLVLSLIRSYDACLGLSANEKCRKQFIGTGVAEGCEKFTAA